ncbi:Competence protein A [Thalassoglobus neptunius]|uniref:Competence protein A n=1 Tax=Thalassoglobus neptunius TaxID=1938619 RepID=A0A5C5WID8_9PLAN|nr:hypothetical protein [Thalassoglobus neptunius]TWT49889.1 Competence protein A [Thalassoglobus neptunius]
MSTKLIVEWSRYATRFLQADTSGRVSHVAEFSHDQLNDMTTPADEIADSLSSWMKSSGVTAGPATLLLPRESVVARLLQLPQAPPEEIPDLVRFQAAAKSAMPIDDLAFDYLPVHGDSSHDSHAVLTISTEKRQLTRIQNVLRSIGIEVERVTVSPLAIANVVHQFSNASLGSDEPEMVIYQRGLDLEISIFDRRSLVFSHSINLPDTDHLKPLESALTRSIVALNQTHPNVSIDRCFLVGSHTDDSIRTFLEQRFRGNVQHVSIDEAHSRSHDIAGFEPLIGAAIPPPEQDLSVDLIHPRKRIEKPDRSRLYWTVGGVLAASALLLGYFVFRSQKLNLEASIVDIDSKIFQINKVLEAGKPTMNAFSNIDQWQLGDAPPIDSWNSLRNSFPGTDRVYLSELRFSPLSDPAFSAQFKGIGFAKQRSDIEQLADLLVRNGFEVIPTTPRNSGIDPDYPFTFDMDVKQIRVITLPPSKEEEAVETAQSEADAASPSKS